MINFKLFPKNFNYLEKQFTVIPINITNFNDFHTLIEETIKHFNDELKWDEMFTMDDVLDRLGHGMTIYVGLIDSDVFGHVWFRNHEDGRFLFNVFVRNNVANKTYTGKEFVSDVIHRFEYSVPIYCEVDDWNEKSIKLFNRLGFQVQ